MQTIPETLSAYAASLKYEDLPAEVVHKAKSLILDTMGCAFGGYGSEPANIACHLAGTISAAEPATVWFSGRKTSAELAVFANDVMSRYLDYNDGYISKGSGHPSDSIPAVIAAGELAHANGRELIAATVVAYEVFCRICDAWDNKPRGIDHATIGAIASAAGAARLLALTPPQIVEAINLTAAANIALNQTRVGRISKWKACGYANANRNAMFAVQLAACGMTGPPQVFEGRDGFFNVVSRGAFELGSFGGKSEPFRIMQCHIKQFPLGNFAQSVVTAALQARAFVRDVRDIEEVHVRTSQSGINIMADDPQKWRPPNRETADHSMPYAAAVALLFGTIHLRYFEDEYLHNEALLRLVGRIKCSASEEATRRGAEMNLCELDLTLRSGERKSIRIEYHRGHSRNPMSDEEMEEKFRSMAGDLLPPNRIAALLRQLWALEGLRDVGELIEMIRIEGMQA